MENRELKDDNRSAGIGAAQEHRRHGENCSGGGHAPPFGTAVSGKLLAIFALTSVYTAAEAVGGFLTESLALLADAGHMAVDALALGLALLAHRLSARPATAEKTFGYFRFETLTAFINAATLLLISVSIFYEAGERLFYPVEVDGGGMTWVAAGGLLVNLLSIRILHGQHNHDLNSRGAWLHLLGDALGSVGAISAGVLISATGWQMVDPLISIAIVGLIVYGSWALIKKAAHVLLEGAPAHLSFAKVERSILETDGVRDVHDLHLWEISSGREALSCHVVHGESVASPELLAELQKRLRHQFGIRHLTLQMELDEGFYAISGFCREASRGCFSRGRK